MSLARQFHKSLENQWLTRFETDVPPMDHFTGVVVLVQRGFVVILESTELAWDGFEIVPKGIITGFRDAGYEACANAIHRHRGEIDAATCPDWLGSCRTLRDVVTAMQARDIWPGIEVVFESDEEEDGVDTAFYLGPVVDVDEDTFSVHCYDATGAWEGVYVLAYDEIVRICFDDTYTTRFNAWMRAEGPERPVV